MNLESVRTEFKEVKMYFRNKYLGIDKPRTYLVKMKSGSVLEKI